MRINDIKTLLQACCYTFHKFCSTKNKTSFKNQFSYQDWQYEIADFEQISRQSFELSRTSFMEIALAEMRSTSKIF